MKNKIFYHILILLTYFTANAQTPVTPSQHISLRLQSLSTDTTLIVDSVYAGYNYTSLISIDYSIYYNGVLIDTMSKFGWASLTMRSQGNAYVSKNLDLGSINLPGDIPLYGMSATCFSLGIINSSKECNRNRPIMLHMQLKKVGYYKVVMAIYKQDTATPTQIAAGCNYLDYFGTGGKKDVLWTKDSVTFYIKQDPYYIDYYDTAECSYTWHDSLYTKSGKYTYLQAVSPVRDTVQRLFLNLVRDTIFNSDSITVLSTSFPYKYAYKIFGDTTKSGIYPLHFYSYKFCDSIVRLKIRVVYVNPVILELNSCLSDLPYRYKDSLFYNAGSYSVRYVGSNGYDSLDRIVLKTHQSYLFNDYIDICSGTCNWHGKRYSVSGIYYDSLHTVHGCDSVYCLNLRVNPVYLFRDTVDICQGGDYFWRSGHFNKSGIYYDSLHTVHGCDSVYCLKLTERPLYQFNDTMSVCKGDIYPWRGRHLTNTGIYYDSLYSIYGCDSVYILNLYYSNHYLIKDTASICEGSSYLWRGKLLSVGGYYTDSLKTVSGCDSVFRLVLYVNKVYFYDDTIEICADLYQWHGRCLVKSGTYYDSLKTANGCDSIYRLTLRLHPQFYYADTVYICEGSLYSWRGKSLFAAGVYYDSLKSIYACDSVYSLDLRNYSNYYFRDTAETCISHPYNWRGKVLTRTGVYYDKLKTQNHCDSIYSLVLFVNKEYYNVDTVSICDNDLYEWHNIKITEAGLYYDSLKSIKACDSIETVYVILRPTYHKEVFDTICAGEEYSNYGFEISSDTTEIYSDLVYGDTLKSSVDCDSSVILNLHILHYADSLSEIFGDSIIIEKGKHYYYVDSIPEALQYVWSCSNQEWDLEFDNNNASLIINVNDTAVISVYASHICGNTSTSYLRIRTSLDVISATATISGIILYPNPAENVINIKVKEIEKFGSLSWSIFNFEGKLLSKGLLHSDIESIDISSYPKGGYIINVSSGSEIIANLKVLKH